MFESIIYAENLNNTEIIKSNERKKLLVLFGVGCLLIVVAIKLISMG